MILIAPYYKDHLGNVRLSYKNTSSTGVALQIVEENNYYPFGLKHKGYNNMVQNSNSVASKFKYNGVEHEEALGLDLYEMDFRLYDPAIGRFNGIDPVTHYSKGTSVAFDTNPVFWADSSGADGEHYNWNTGRYENDEGNEISMEQAFNAYGLHADGSNCKTCKSEYKGDNFDYKSNLKKIRSGNYTDGGHWMGSGKEPNYPYKVKTNEYNTSLTFVWDSAELIEKFNEQVRQANSNLNNMKDILIAIIAAELGVGTFGGAGIGLGMHHFASIDTAKINLNPGDKWVFSVTTQTIRSYDEGTEQNGVKFILTQSVQNSQGTTVINSNTSFMSLNPISNNKHNILLKKYENRSGRNSYTHLNRSYIPLNTEIRRTN